MLNGLRHVHAVIISQVLPKSNADDEIIWYNCPTLSLEGRFMAGGGGRLKLSVQVISWVSF